MGKLKSAVAAASLTVIDGLIDSVPDPLLKQQLKSFTFAVKVPYAFLKELYKKEPDEVLNEVLKSGKITLDVINSPEFQQALGNTFQYMAYAKEKEKRDLIKKAFIGAYISQDEYSKDHLERLQDTAQRISLPALQHLGFVKKEILPLWEKEMEIKAKEPLLSPDFIGLTHNEIKKMIRGQIPIARRWEYEIAEDERLLKDIVTSNPYETKSVLRQKLANNRIEYWLELNILGIFKQGNSSTGVTNGEGGEGFQYLTEFGENFINYVEALSKHSIEI